jgi:nucleoside-diphosphate-sugar epimerase
MSGPAGQVAITGASGFIGGRTAEHLVRRGDVSVRAVVRGYGRLARLSPLPQDRLSFAVADICDTDALAAAFSGCHAVVHCAFGSSGEVADRWRASVDGTAQVLAAARQAGVRRLVHLSTVEVYDGGSDILDESAAPLRESAEDREYEQQKLAAERLVLAGASGLERVVLQPATVYGPWAAPWTVAQLQRLPADTGALPTGDHGHCAALYVDDLVSAIEQALEVPGIDGERFVLAGAEQVSWGRFFDAYRAMLGLAPPAAPVVGAIEAWEQELYDRPGRVVSAKAARALGWRGVTTLDEGMAVVREWAAWMGLLGQP